MAFEKKVPEWNAAGSEPPVSLKTSGFQPGYKPPADYFNWFMYGVSEALTELQNDAVAHYTGMVSADYTFNDALVRGKYLVTGTNIDGAPYTGNAYGTLFVFMADNKKEWTGGNLHWLTQIFVSTNGEFYTRWRINSADFTTWVQFYTTADKPTLNELSGTVSIAKGGTGATDNLKALDNLCGIASYRGTVNGTSYTFNTALTQGEYLVTGTDLEGAPLTGTIYGKLVVTVSNGHTHDEATNWIWQTYYSTKYGHVYMRNKVNAGAWSSWSLVYNASLTVPVANGGTGATTINNAVANLLCKTLINNTSIVDANTLVKTGIHKVYVTDATLAANNNYPYVYGNLVVISNMEETNYAYVMQMFLTTDGKMYLRASTNTGSTWTEWTKSTNADTVDGIHVQTAPGNSGLKCIYATTADLTAGTSALATGTICLIYE